MALCRETAARDKEERQFVAGRLDLFGNFDISPRSNSGLRNASLGMAVAYCSMLSWPVDVPDWSRSLESKRMKPMH